MGGWVGEEQERRGEEVEVVVVQITGGGGWGGAWIGRERLGEEGEVERLGKHDSGKRMSTGKWVMGVTVDEMKS